MDPLAGQLGDRYGLTVRPVRVSVGRWRLVLNLLIASNDPGTMERTRSRIRVCEGLDSAAFLYACSCHLSLVSCRCYVLPGGPRRVMAKPEEVVTGSRLSGTTGGIMWDALWWRWRPWRAALTGSG